MNSQPERQKLFDCTFKGSATVSHTFHREGHTGNFLLVSYLSIPSFSTANRLAEQTTEYKRQHGPFQKVPRRLSTQLSSVDYQRDSQDDEFEEELQDDSQVQA